MPDGTAPLPETGLRDDPARIERQLAMLDALAAAGVQAAREVGRQAEQGQTPAAEIALAYARVSRAVRLTIQLQTKLVEGLQALEAEAAEVEARRQPAYARKARVERIVERLAKAEHGDDEDEIDRIVIEAGERLDDEDLYGDILERPFAEIVALVCRDLGLTPDWSEAWAQEEMKSEAPFPKPVRPPPLAGEGDREAVERACRRDSG